MIVSRVGEKALKNGKEEFSLTVKGYNTLGEELDVGSSLKGKLIVIRMQASNIISPHDESNLGSVLSADTFFSID